MAKLLSFASWNVENFYGEPARAGRVVEIVAARDPDVFAIYEVRGKDVYTSRIFPVSSSTMRRILSLSAKARSASWP